MAEEKRFCPRCGKPLVLREGLKKDGTPYRFWGCSGFPACDYIAGSEKRKKISSDDLMKAIRIVNKNIGLLNKRLEKIEKLLKE